MKIVIDTSVVIAVIMNEPHKARLIELTRDAELIAPGSLYYEVGNAFSAMFKRKRIELEQAQQALTSYREIPIALVEIPLEDAVQLSSDLDIYAYDAYMLCCTQQTRGTLLTLDDRLRDSANELSLPTIEVMQ